MPGSLGKTISYKRLTYCSPTALAKLARNQNNLKENSNSFIFFVLAIPPPFVSRGGLMAEDDFYDALLNRLNRSLTHCLVHLETSYEKRKQNDS